MDATRDGIWIEASDAKEQVSDLKLGRMLTVEEFMEVADGPTEKTLAEPYRLYEAELVKTEQIDFDDYIFQSVRLLQRDAVVRKHWQGEFSVVLVDEFQDIEPVQELLIQMLAAPEDLLFCVGDEDQTSPSIHGDGKESRVSPTIAATGRRSRRGCTCGGSWRRGRGERRGEVVHRHTINLGMRPSRSAPSAATGSMNKTTSSGTESRDHDG
jgi:hypothetical protein